MTSQPVYTAELYIYKNFKVLSWERKERGERIAWWGYAWCMMGGERTTLWTCLSLSPPLPGFQGSNSSHQAIMARAFTRLAILVAPIGIFKKPHKQVSLARKARRWCILPIPIPRKLRQAWPGLHTEFLMISVGCTEDLVRGNKH